MKVSSSSSENLGIEKKLFVLQEATTEVIKR
jgi:hypothetical protein